jgi:hypothetical protein
MTPAVSIFSLHSALLDEAVKGRGVEDDACVQWYDIPCRGTSSARWTPAIRCAIGCAMCCVNRARPCRRDLLPAGHDAGLSWQFPLVERSGAPEAGQRAQ